MTDLFTTTIAPGILTNIATQILVHHSQSLEDTVAGRILKGAGLIEPNLYDRLQELLLKALNLYFNRYPQRDLRGLDCFFLDPEVSRQVGSYILERNSIDWNIVQQAFQRQLNSNNDSLRQLENQNLNFKQIIEDFIECYREVLREQLSLPQVVILLELLNQSENLIAEIRASEQRIQEFIVQLQTNQLSSRNLNLAYQSGQQELAHNLTEEMDTVGLLYPEQALQVIQARLDLIPALFDMGLCKGRQLSANPNEYFVSHGFDSDLLADWRNTLEETLAQSNERSEVLQPYFSGDTLLGGFRLCGLCEKLHTTRFSMFLLPPSQDRNVYLELGIAIGLRIPFFLVQHYEADIPKILDGLTRYTKGGLFRTMRRELGNQIEEYDFGVVRFTVNSPPADSQTKYLIAAGELIEDEDFEGSITDTIKKNYPHLEQKSLTQQLGNSNSGWMLEQLIELIQTSHFAIYRIDEECSPTTFLALGVSIGLNRPFLMINRTNREVPVDLRGMGIYQFPNFVTLEKEIISRHQSFFDRYN